MSGPEVIRLTDVITPEEFTALTKYIERNPDSTVRNNILDWLGTQPAVLERMNRHKLILTYFAYLLQAFIKE